MKKKKITAVAVIVSAVIIAVFLLAGNMFGLFEKLPKPEIKEGEFDFTLTYEDDGEIKKIEGTYVCKFKGVSRAIDGIGRQWKGYIKGHDDFTDYEIKTTDDGVIKIDLDICSEFFMSDPFYKLSGNTDDPKPEPYIYITSGNSDVEDPSNEVFFSIYEGEDVKIISFEYDEPIENIYK